MRSIVRGASKDEPFNAAIVGLIEVIRRFP